MKDKMQLPYMNIISFLAIDITAKQTEIYPNLTRNRASRE